MRRIYLSVSVIALNLTLLFLAANLIASLWAPSPDPRNTDTHAWLIDVYGFDRLARAYPGWKRGDLRTLLVETSNWVTEFEPFTQLRMKPRRDRFITVSEHGFREEPDQAPWPPSSAAINVFFFGGSTALGAGLPDNQTIPAHVQRLARACTQPVAIYNFARGFYFSTQERILFDQLLASGVAPTLAVFVDGLNDFYYAEGIPQWTDELRLLMSQASSNAPLEHLGRPTTLGEGAAAFVESLPLARLAGRLRSAATPASNDALSDASLIPQTPPAMVVPLDTPSSLKVADPLLELAKTAIDRIEMNRRMIRQRAKGFAVETAFVLQPVPTYGYDLRYLNVYQGDPALFGKHINSAAGYRLLADRAHTGRLDPEVLWLGDIQQDRHENLYVDAVHYTDAFSREIAAQVFGHLRASGLLPCR